MPSYVSIATGLLRGQHNEEEQARRDAEQARLDEERASTNELNRVRTYADLASDPRLQVEPVPDPAAPPPAAPRQADQLPYPDLAQMPPPPAPRRPFIHRALEAIGLEKNPDAITPVDPPAKTSQRTSGRGAELEVGGQRYSVRARPTETPEAVTARKEAGNRQAYDVLHGQDAEAYPSYVAGFDYADEVAHYAQGVRSGRNRESTGGGSSSADRTAARTERRNRAENNAYELFAQGKDMAAVMQELEADPESRGLLRPLDLSRIRRDAQSVADDPARKERRSGIVRNVVRAEPTSELQQAIVESLTDGQTADEVLAYFRKAVTDNPTPNNQATLARVEYYLKAKAINPDRPSRQ